MPATTMPDMSWLYDDPTDVMTDLPPHVAKAQHEIDTFKAWAEKRAALSNFSVPDSLRKEHPFLAALLEKRNEAFVAFRRGQHYKKALNKIIGRDKRCRNRARRRLRPYLSVTQKEPPFSASWYRTQPTLRRAAPLEGSNAELAEQLLADLECIQNTLEEYGYSATETMFRGQHVLSWEWDVDAMEDERGDTHDLGTYTVSLDANGRVWVDGGNYQKECHCHPHVASDGSMCLGDFQNFKSLLCQDGALAAVFDNVNGLVSNYNDNSPYISLRRLVEAEFSHCTRCGSEILDDDNRSYVGDELYCSDCVWTCDSCYETFSISDEQIEVRGRYYCEDCAAEKLHQCADCGDWLDDRNAIFCRNDEDEEESYCKNCVKTCEECKNHVATQHAIEIGRDHYHRNCTCSCECCGDDTPHGDAIEIDNEFYCDGCVSTCEICGKRVCNDNIIHYTDKDDCIVDVCDDCHFELEL